MTIDSQSLSTVSTTRRQFLKTTSIIAATSATATAAETRVAAVHGGGSDMIKVGLIGCGGRGTGAALNAIQADEHVVISAMADAFEDRIDLSLRSLERKPKAEGKFDVPKERQFVGFNAYQELIDSEVDVVILATPPHFRPLHLRAAIDAGKHVFCEKPVAVDAPGIRSVLNTCQMAKEKNLSVVSGLCLRYDGGHIEAVQRIHDGAIGDVVTLFANDYRGPIWVRTPEPDWTDMHVQMRNWYYYSWLSGDFNVEQHVHILDICSWVKRSYPVKAVGMGGRQVRTRENFGNIFDHHSVVYEYEDGSHLVSNCRQQAGCATDTNCIAHGNQGVAQISERKIEITNSSEWRYREKDKNMYDVEHDHLFKSIRTGNPINNGEYMCHSTLLAIMGRMATYTGQSISWEQAMNSQEDLTPKAYEWGSAPAVNIARPGITKFV